MENASPALHADIHGDLRTRDVAGLKEKVTVQIGLEEPSLEIVYKGEQDHGGSIEVGIISVFERLTMNLACRRTCRVLLTTV